jgi:hypothetical protein
MSEGGEGSVDQFIIYGGYGAVMHRLQVLELSLWIIQTRGIKRGVQPSQARAKVEKWNATTLGELMRGMRTQSHWPDGMVDSLLQAVEIRNYLAHHFLREYFIVAPPEANRKRAAEELAGISVWLQELGSKLDDHVRSLGLGDIEELDEETVQEIDSLRPIEWISMPTRHRN